jgi:hypothetical protein
MGLFYLPPQAHPSGRAARPKTPRSDEVTTHAFSEDHPRRGSRRDVAIRKHRLKNQKERLPRMRDIPKLERKAVEEVAEANGSRGVYPEGRSGMTVEAQHSDIGECIITGRRSNLDYHEPGDFRRSRDPGSQNDPRKRVLIWRKFHDDITFQGWRDELKDGRYRCWNAEGEVVRDVPVRLDEKLGCMVADWKDEEVVFDIRAYLAPAAPPLADLLPRLMDCSDEALASAYEEASAATERCYVVGCLAVTVLRDRYRFERWPAKAPSGWHGDKPYPPEEPYWTHVVSRIIGSAPRTVYRRAEVWSLFEKIASNGKFEQVEDILLEMGKQAWNLLLQASDKEAAFQEALDLKAERGEVKGDSLAARLQEKGFLPRAKWEYACPCGCGWVGKQSELLKRPSVH